MSLQGRLRVFACGNHVPASSQSTWSTVSMVLGHVADCADAETDQGWSYAIVDGVPCIGGVWAGDGAQHLARGGVVTSVQPSSRRGRRHAERPPQPGRHGPVSGQHLFDGGLCLLGLPCVTCRLDGQA